MADAIKAGGCKVSGCGIDGGEEDSELKMDIITSTYIY